jgi:tRNA threonylcarbamoyladenosine biosynthesis protein TsaB
VAAAPGTACTPNGACQLIAFRVRFYPVLILALDTTTRGGSVAVTRDDRLLALVEGDGSRTHGERLPGEIAQALEIAAVAGGDLDLLVVGIGPGAFTGLRIGLATVQGLAMVWGVPVLGVSALDALADASRASMGQARTLAAWMDAQRGEVFSARYVLDRPQADVMWEAESAPFVARPAELLPQLIADDRPVVFAGDGAVRYRADIEAWAPGRPRVVLDVPLLAPAMARIGRHLRSRGGGGLPHALQPLYVRRPDVELERLRRRPQ